MKSWDRRYGEVYGIPEGVKHEDLMEFSKAWQPGSSTGKRRQRTKRKWAWAGNPQKKRSKTSMKEKSCFEGAGLPALFGQETRVEKVITVGKRISSISGTIVHTHITDKEDEIVKSKYEKLTETEKLKVQLVQSVRQSTAQGESILVAKVLSHTDEDWRAAMEILARRWPQRWGRKDKLPFI